MRLEGYARSRADADGGRLVVVSRELDIPAPPESHEFGLVRVAVFSGASRDDQLRRVFEWLDTGLGDRVDARYVHARKACADIAGWIEVDRDRAELVALYYESLMRTQRQRHLPPQHMDIPRQEW